MTARRRLRGALAVLASACLGCSSVWVRDDARIDPPRSLAVLPFLPAAELRFEHAADPELLAHLGARADQLQRVIAGTEALCSQLATPGASSD